MLAGQGITSGMGRKGKCDGDVPTESFSATVKKERVHHEKYAAVAAAMAGVFEFVEVFCNRRRRRSSLGNVSPAQFETGKHPEPRALFSWGTPLAPHHT